MYITGMNIVWHIYKHTVSNSHLWKLVCCLFRGSSQEMPESEVILGYAEEVSAKNKKRILQDVTISRIGGSPSWLKGKIPKDDILLCPKCSKSMKLLLQVNTHGAIALSHD